MSLPTVSEWGKEKDSTRTGPQRRVVVGSGSDPTTTWRCFHVLGGKLAASDPRARWRVLLGEAAEHPVTHAAMLLLIFLDVICVFGEVMLRDVCPIPDAGASGDGLLRTWEDALSWISRALLLVLLLHQLVLIVAFGRSFFRKLTYALDLLIVCVALALEAAHLSIEMKHAGDAVGAHDAGHGDHDAASDKAHGPDDASAIIVVLLSWRVVRVIHGFLMTATAHAHDDSEHRDARTRVELKDALLRVETLERELALLRAGGEGLPGAIPPPPPPIVSALVRAASLGAGQ